MIKNTKMIKISHLNIKSQWYYIYSIYVNNVSTSTQYMISYLKPVHIKDNKQTKTQPRTKLNKLC